MSAVAPDAQACLTRVEKELADAMRGPGRPCMLQVTSGLMVVEIPAPRMLWQSAIIQMGVVSSKPSAIRLPAARTAMETAITLAWPKRSARTPPSGLQTSATTAAGSSTVPAAEAGPPWQFSMKRGITRVMPMNDPQCRHCIANPASKRSDEKIPRSMRGLSVRFS